MNLSEKEHAALVKIKEFEDTVDPSDWKLGWEWYQVGVHASIINNLLTKGLVSRTYESNKHKCYKLTDNGKDLASIPVTENTQEQPLDELDLTGCFSSIVGHEDLKELLVATLQLDKPIHVMMYGPPAVSKSLFMWEIEKVAGDRALWLMGSASSKAGIWDIIAQRKPQILLIDEIEKMKQEDMAGLLGLMEKGRIVRTKVNKNMDLTLKTCVIATANRIDRIPGELKSRFAIRKVEEYSAKEYVAVVESVLQVHEGLPKEEAFEIAMKLVAKTHDVRDAIRVARLSLKVGVPRAIELLLSNR